MKPSLPTKIAAFLFLLGSFGSLLNFVNALLPMISSGVSSDADGLVALPMAVLMFLTGWFLAKLRRWAYILGLTLTIVALIVLALLSLRTGEVATLGLAEAAVLLILLIAGRKDFRKA